MPGLGGRWSRLPGEGNGQRLPVVVPAGSAQRVEPPAMGTRCLLTAAVSPLPSHYAALTLRKETQGLAKWARNNSRVGFSEPLLAAAQGAGGASEAASPGCLP